MAKKMYPKMVYHPHTGEHTICETADDIPTGYVKSLADVVPEGEKTAKGALAGSAGKPLTKADKVAAMKTAKAAKEAGKSALKALNTTREEALEMLDEEKVEYDDDASDDVIAGLVKDLLT